MAETPNNSEIIDELTKNLQNTQFDSPAEPATDIPKDFEDSDPEDSTVRLEDNDSSDEESLKNAELDLTDEEKSERRKEATVLKNRGNEEFKSGNYVKSVITYTEGLHICPLKYPEDRAVLYANRAASKIQTERKASAIQDCTKAIKLNDRYVRAYLRRARLYEETDKLDECLEDYKKILEVDPGNKDALSGNHRLPPLIAERNEKLKTEMLGKLKDLGNAILRPFGLSTNNFQFQQDPNTGGYSVNFQQKPPE